MKRKTFRFFSWIFVLGVLAAGTILSVTSVFDLHAIKAMEVAFFLAFVSAVVGYIGFAVSGLYILFQKGERYRLVAFALGIAGLIIELILYEFDMEPMLLGCAFPLVVPVGICLAAVSIVMTFRNKRRLDALATVAALASALPLAVVVFLA
jgi:hypothetical protein